MTAHYGRQRDYCYGCRRMMFSVNDTGLCRLCRSDEGDPPTPQHDQQENLEK